MSNLSETEKKVVENLKNEYKKMIDNENILFPLYKWQTKIVIELIDKLQKENEELKENKELKNEVAEKELIIIGMKEDRRIAVEEVQEQYFISKDKIRNKIKELEELKEKRIKGGLFENMEIFQIDILQELLGDDENE